MLNDIASNTSFFGIFITGVAYVLACAIQKRFKASILNPLLVSCVILIIFMLVSGIDYNVYLYGKPKADGTYDGTGAIFFQNMLTPTTVCLAIPLYEKLVYLKKYPVAIGVSCGTGAHAMGTSRAREFGEIEEAMSGLSIAVCGLLTVVGASIFAMIRF